MAMKFIQLYFTYRDAIEELSDEECGRVVKALLRYATEGALPDFSGKAACKQTFLIMARQFDSDAKSYEKRAVGGRRGGRPSKTNDENALSEEDGDGKAENAQKTFMCEGFDGFHIKEGKGRERKGRESSSKEMDAALCIVDGGTMTTTTDLLEFSTAAFEGSRVHISRSLSETVDALGLDLTRAVLKNCAAAGGHSWAYVEAAVKKCIATGITTVEEYEAHHQRETGRQVDRAAPSGNDILAAARSRPLRLKREE